MDFKAFYTLSYGMYVISSVFDGKFNAQMANSLFQVTSDPPKVAVSINKGNLTHEYIENSKVFAASVLSEETPLRFIGDFGFKSGRETDKFKDVKFKEGVTGAPVVLDNAVAYLEVEVRDSVDLGTHTVFIGDVVNAEMLSETSPMSYAFYHKVKRGVAPKSAPTYVKE